MQKNRRLIKHRAAIGTLILALAVTIFLVYKRIEDDRPPPDLNRHFTVFGTFGSIKLWHTNSLTDANQATDAVLTYLDELHETINVFSPDSELSRLNRTAYEQPFKCSDMLWDILLASRQAHEQTSGYFDVTIGRLLQLWGFYEARQEWPPTAELNEALASVGLEQVEFNHREQSIRFTHPMTMIDLGGIAKGYALDRVGEILQDWNIHSGLIDLGGDMLCLDPPQESPGYTIAIRDPMQSKRDYLDTVTIANMAIATSGNYENFRELDGQTIGHIFNPKTGQPTVQVISATVLSPSALEAEIFATAIIVKGREMARQFIRQNEQGRVIMVYYDDHGEVKVEELPAANE